MPTYFAIFGKTPALSAAEIFSLCTKKDGVLRAERVHQTGMLWEEDVERDAPFWERLGGSVKAGIIVQKQPFDRTKADICTTILADIAARAPEGRVLFGISLYPLDALGEKQAKSFTSLGAEVKRALVEEGRSARHVTSHDETLSAVTITKNHLLSPGIEYCIFLDGGMIAIGVTTWVQGYEDFGEREFGRPRANSRSGMLPVKLARMLINLTHTDTTATILDPFCGSGTIVTEALSLGYTHIIGSDILLRAVEETKENSAWMAKKTGTQATVDIQHIAVERLSEVVAARSVDAIATEPYLGPPLRGSEPHAFVADGAKKLEQLYSAAFAQFATVLKNDAVVVFTLPHFVRPRVTAFAQLLSTLQNLGFTQEIPLPQRFQKTHGFSLSPQGGLLYGRDDQRVLREILCFRFQPPQET